MAFDGIVTQAITHELKNDLRHFELKRINKIELLDEKF